MNRPRIMTDTALAKKLYDAGLAPAQARRDLNGILWIWDRRWEPHKRLTDAIAVLEGFTKNGWTWQLMTEGDGGGFIRLNRHIVDPDCTERWKIVEDRCTAICHVALRVSKAWDDIFC